jgi:Trehalose receptor
MFKWISLRTFISIIFMLSSFASVYFEYNNVATGKHILSLANISGIVFYGFVSIGYIFLFNISRQLSGLMMHWMKTETELNKVLEQPPTKWSIKKRVNVVISIYLGLACAEHMLAVASTINGISVDYAVCQPKEVDFIATFINRKMHFFVISMPFKYNNFVGLFYEYYNIAATLTWNYIDLVIIVICIGMSSMFDKLNYRIESLRHLIVSEITWSEVREDYVKVCELLRRVNDMFGSFVAFSCANDGYFIVLQLLNIMK